jgi:serine/threonine-protein kinase
MSETESCSSCGRPIDSRDVFCTHCGATVVRPQRPCEKCGASLDAADQFCTTCGTPAPGAPSELLQDSADGEAGETETPWEAVLKQLRAVTEGRFEIERELGEGGMAAVYLAHEVALRRRVAIKVMSPAVLMERGTVGRFKQEAITIAALKHPHIVTVHGVEHHDQLHFFVLDFVEGGSLEDVLRRTGPLPIPVVRAWLVQVASALEYAHKRRVVHRDIKPANILLDGEGNAVVTDFGIAKVAEKQGFTVTGSTVGTPTYMSPEQCLGKAVTGASDQYALGAVVYEMLTGAPPFSGATLAVMRAHTETPPTPVAQLRPECPQPLAAAVMRMLAKNPSERWGNLAEMVAAYGGTPPGLHDPVKHTMATLARGERPSDYVAAGPVTPTTPVPGVSAALGPGVGNLLARHRRPLGIGMAAVVVAAAGLTVLMQSRDGGPDPVATLPRLGSLEITPVPAALNPGETLELSAVLRDSTGATVYGEPVAWTSSDETVVMIADGRLEARRSGTARVSASSGGQTRSVEVLVRSPSPTPTPEPDARVATVRLSPGVLSLSVGESGSITASAVDASGRTLAGRATAWSVTDPAVATVSADGQVRGLASGTTEVVATIDGRRARASITVTAESVASVALSPNSVELEPGASISLSATVLGARGSVLTGRALVWQSSNPAVATVADGVVRGVAPGTATIAATAEGRAGQATVTVRAAAPVIDDAEAGRQIGGWIDTFTRELDAAVRGKDLAAVRAAYRAPMSSADAAEWQRRFALDARWRATLARTYPARRVGGSWVSDFELEITVEAGGRTTSGPQRFLAVFEPRGGQLAVTSLEMRLSQEP